MGENSFSRQHGFRPSTPLLAYDRMPGWVRKEIYYLMDRLVPVGYRTTFIGEIQHVLRPYLRREYPADNEFAHHATRNPWTETENLLVQVDWFTVLDLCQEIYRVMHSVDLPADQLNIELNKVFNEASVAWRMTGEDFERVMDEATAAQIQAAKSILGEPRFEAPNDQFTLALTCFSERPEPNLKDSINNAIESIEGVARIISGQPGVLSRLLDAEPLRGKIHGTLRETLKKLYAFRGDVTGHGQTGTQVEFYDAREAEWVLGMCSTSIVYLSKKFPS